MEDLLEKVDAIIIVLPHILSLVAQFLGGVTIAATAIARLTPSKSDDEKVAKIANKVWAVIEWMPTVGVNPRTKEIKEGLDKTRE